MISRIPARIFVFILIAAAFTLYSDAQTPDGSYIWIKVYGDAGAKAQMFFGNHDGNSRGIDTSTILTCWKENEVPGGANPGFDVVWSGITYDQFPGMRGLLSKDIRGTEGGVTQKDTFDLKFYQTDNGAATISFKWADASYIANRADSLRMAVFDPHGNYVIDMMATDTLTIPAAGDSGIFKIRIFKYGARNVDQCPIIATVKDQLFPEEFLLFQNYPNPFNPATEIRFEVPVSGFVSLKVFDVLGRELATLVHEQKAPGSYTVSWDASPQTSGVYYYRLATPSFVEVRKMMLVK